MKRLLWVFAVLAITLVVLDRHAAAQVPFGSVAAGAATVVVHPASPYPYPSGVTTNVLGADIINSFSSLTNSGVPAAFNAAGLKLIRYPGGGQADAYDWQTNTDNGSAGLVCFKQSSGLVSYPSFMSSVVLTANPVLTPMFQVNYGSNAVCTDGGSPTLAAAWVTDYLTNYTQDTKTFWTVGNEQYFAACTSNTNCGGNLNIDLHGCSSAAGCTGIGNPPGKTYATFEPAFYTQMHEAAAALGKSINVCIDGYPQGRNEKWDLYVLKNALYDCVEVHYYPENPGQESDSYLIKRAPPALTQFITTENNRLSAAGRAGTPIYIAELGEVSNNPGVQYPAIPSALYYAQAVGEMLQDGVARATVHAGFGSCNTPPPSPWPASGQVPNFLAPPLYSWQNFGTSAIFSGNNSNCNSAVTNIPSFGTLMSGANGMLVASNFVRNGETMLHNTESGNGQVQAYSTTYNGGYAVMLINQDQSSAISTTVSIDGVSGGTGGNICQYSKALYDNTQGGSPTWSPPTCSSFGSWSTNYPIALPPWSVTVIQFTTGVPTPTPSPTAPPIMGAYILGGGNQYACCPDVDPGATPDQHLMAGVINAAANNDPTLATNCPGPNVAGNVTNCTPSKYINSLWLICDTTLTAALYAAATTETEFTHIYPGAITSGNRDSNGNYGDCGGMTGTRPVYFMNPGDPTYQSLLYTTAWNNNTTTGFPSPYAISEDNFGIVGFPCNQLTEYGANQPCNLVGNGPHADTQSWESALASFANNACQAKCVSFRGNGLTPGGGSQTGSCSSIFQGHCFVPGFNGVIDDQDALDSFCASATSGNVIGLEAEEIVYLKGTPPNPTYANTQTMVYMINTMADLYTHTSDGCSQLTAIDDESSSGSFYPLSGYNQGSVSAGIPIRMEDLAFEWLVPDPVTGMPDRIRPRYFTTGGTSDSSEVPYFFEETMVPQGAERAVNKFVWNGFTATVGDGCPTESGDTGGALNILATCVAADPDKGAAVLVQSYKHLWIDGTDYGPAAAILNTSSATTVNIVSSWFTCMGCDAISSYKYRLNLVGGELTSVPYPGLGTISLSSCSNVTFCTGSTNLATQTLMFKGDGTDTIGPRSGLILLGSQ